jgi:glutamate-1-semialdehyde 2,1-aminomutase
MSWGPLILGHAHPAVIEAVERAARLGTTFGAPTELETELARRVTAAFPSIEKIRFTSSGTEACMSAIRLARAFTGRTLVVKFDGCYHGHSDSLLSMAGSGAMTFGIPSSPGVTKATAAETITLPYNDSKAVKSVLDENKREIACVIVEPVAGNMGVVPPEKGFLETLRKETARHGIVLIFDEVITGFRLAFGGAQELYDMRADLTTVGKIVGGGLPAAAFGGRADIMAELAPDGPVYQAGTLSGNPLAMAAGCAALDEISKNGFYKHLDAKAALLASGLEKILEKHGVPARINRAGSMFTLFFTNLSVRDMASAASSDNERFVKWHSAMLSAGVYLAPSRFEASFMSAAHTDRDIEATLKAADEAAGSL